jgi:hypothetical protein
MLVSVHREYEYIIEDLPERSVMFIGPGGALYWQTWLLVGPTRSVAYPWLCRMACPSDISPCNDSLGASLALS